MNLRKIQLYCRRISQQGRVGTDGKLQSRGLCCEAEYSLLLWEEMGQEDIDLLCRELSPVGLSLQPIVA